MTVPIVYVENAVAGHPRARRALARFPHATVVPCERFSEVFNPRAQNFRLQKQRPALILATKPGRRVLAAPAGYGVGGARNFYFSHMLNCLYDCRYCFLQGMYRSAHYVLFVNYEDFVDDMDRCIDEHEADTPWFFSGYDGDSLAMEPVSGFVEHFVGVMADRPEAFLELRTKSTQIRSLLAKRPLPNVVAAFSFTSESLSRRFERNVPALIRRIEAVAALQERGWPVGLRFDPLIYEPDFEMQYRDLFERIFKRVTATRVHSVSLGSFRLPHQYHENVMRLYPDEKLFRGPLKRDGDIVSYRPDLDQALHGFCRTELRRYFSEEQLFVCAS